MKEEVVMMARQAISLQVGLRSRKVKLGKAVMLILRQVLSFSDGRRSRGYKK